ncbi:MAG: putative transposase [Sulfurimonas sp.]|uniref:SapC family protein n=1 Tax=Sulfurimonas sp. TaxID=2022749 RepID=UPI0039E38CC0
MPRKVRLFVENASQHILLRCKDNINIFEDESDYEAFVFMLEELNVAHTISIHAYILMPQYIKFLLTPENSQSISKFMQSLGRKYVGYYNSKYDHIGTIWEGRYKASIIEDKLYLLETMRFIEKMQSSEYLYSSVKKNLFNKDNSIISQHELYEQKKYEELFHRDRDEITYKFIENCLEKQLVTGSIDFIKYVEEIVGISLSPNNIGRPTKQTEEKRKNMYKNLVILDKEQHKSSKLSPVENLLFAKNVSFVPILTNEVYKIGSSLPIVFSANEEASLISLVSLGGENLAINEEGKWINEYIPSYLRKYPFSLAAAKDNLEKKIILIDDEASVVSKSKGKQLFKKNGEQSEVLSDAIKLLTTHEYQAQVTHNVSKLIAQSGILENMDISIGKDEEKKVLVSGFKVVNREKLNALSDDILADWVRKGIIYLIDTHLKSLENIKFLFTLAHERQK